MTTTEDALLNELASGDELAQVFTPEEQKQQKEAQIQRLEAFSHTITNLRKAAIDARKSSGIEEQWQEDEDHYESIDNTNRTTASRTKPYDFGGTGTGPTRSPEKASNRSTVFVPLTRPYVDMAAARIADMYLPTDERNWDGEPTPVPDLIKALDNQTVVAGMDGQPIMQGQSPVMGQDGAPMVDAAGNPMTQPAPLKVADQAKLVMDKATKSWEKARSQIDDWLTECSYNEELRKAIHDMARIGVGIIKGPFPKAKTVKAVKSTPQGIMLEIEQKIVPTTERIDPWRFFPDAACGEDINKGSHVFEQDFITRSKLRDLKAEGLGYITSQIDACMEEGPISSTTGTKKNDAQDRKEADLFEIWYFEGQVEWQDLQDAGCTCEGQKGDVFHGIVTMVNERIVKASLSHMDSGEFSYDVSVWQRKSGLWIGDGVARQGRTAQEGINAGVRNLMDNAGQSSRPHKVINRSLIKPGADPWTWTMNGDSDLNQVSHAMMFFSVPSMQVELMNIIQYFRQMFEDSTGLPMLLMGQQGAAPETVGGMEMLLNNAGTVPRSIVRMLDARFTRPHIRRYYEYLLIYGEDEEAKGDFDIHARGSSALVERDSQTQFLLQVMNLAMNPAGGLDPELLLAELLKSKRINPEHLKLSDEKKKAMQANGPQEDPRITAAKITQQGWIAREQLESKQVADRIAADAHLKMNQMAFDQQENDKDRQNKLALAMIAEQMQSTELSSVERQVLEKIKSDLAKTAMSLNVQQDLSLASHRVDLHKSTPAAIPQVIKPMAEPAGRAPAGQAFQA